MWQALGARDSPEYKAALKRQQAAMLQEQIAEKQKRREAAREQEREIERREEARQKRWAEEEVQRLAREHEQQAAAAAAKEKRQAALMSKVEPSDGETVKPIRRRGNKVEIDIDAEWASWQARNGKEKAAPAKAEPRPSVDAESAPDPGLSARGAVLAPPPPASISDIARMAKPPSLVSTDDGGTQLRLGEDLQRLRQACAEQRAGLRQQADHFSAEAAKLSADHVSLPALAARPAVAIAMPHALTPRQHLNIWRSPLPQRRALSEQPIGRGLGLQLRSLDLGGQLPGWPATGRSARPLQPFLPTPADILGKSSLVPASSSSYPSSVQANRPLLTFGGGLAHAPAAAAALPPAVLQSPAPAKQSGLSPSVNTNLQMPLASPTGSNRLPLSSKGLLVTLQQESTLVFPGQTGPMASNSQPKSISPRGSPLSPSNQASPRISRAGAPELSRLDASSCSQQQRSSAVHAAAAPAATAAKLSARSAGGGGGADTVAGTELSMSLNSLAYSRTGDFISSGSAAQSSAQPAKGSTPGKVPAAEGGQSPSEETQSFDKVVNLGAALRSITLPPGMSSADGVDEDLPSAASGSSWPPDLRRCKTPKLSTVLGEAAGMGGSDIGNSSLASAKSQDTGSMATLLVPPGGRPDSESTPKSPVLPKSPVSNKSEQELLTSALIPEGEQHPQHHHHAAEQTARPSGSKSPAPTDTTSETTSAAMVQEQTTLPAAQAGSGEPA
mmetsp:Transcript_11912/g.27789  ORF Transcript_11912/g.27789 Transcript_11912/m.27789 type:complete len:729 (-) Transcript_11912:208-2394(-)